jgi:transcriptional regulator with XRE-family HTH domain
VAKNKNRLRVQRADRRITQLDLAIKIGMSTGRLWRIENGYLSPTETEKAALAKALKVKPHDLFPAPEAASA